MSLNDFEILQKLGNEEKSSIFKVKRKKDGLIYILKTVMLQSLDKSEKQSSINEIKIVSSLSHPNINEFKEAFFDKFSKSLNIIFEFPHNGNLSNKINYAIKNGMYLEECIIWDVLVQILNGVNYLHKKGIIHRNLKSKNILLNNQRLVKISDFEACCVVENNNKMITGQVGTPFYTAPEIWEEEPYNYKCDIWSIGCIIYEMASLTLPFKGDTIKSLYENIMSKKIEPIPDFYSEDLKKIINYMLIFDPSKRPSTDLLLNYPRIKEESAKLKDIYEKYKNNKNSRNIQNKDNHQIVKEPSSDSTPNNSLVNRNSFTSLNKPPKDRDELNEPLKNQYVNSKSMYSEKAANFIKKDIIEQYKNNTKKVINNTKYRTLNERNVPSFVENRKKGSRSHSKKKGSINNLKEVNNISSLHVSVSRINKINEKVGLSSYSMRDKDINVFLSGSKLKNNLISINPNLENNGEIIEEIEGENDYEPIMNKYASSTNKNNIQGAFIDPGRSPKNKEKNTMKKSPSFKINYLTNKILNKNLIDNKINLADENNISNDDNLASKSNQGVIMDYNKKDNSNFEYIRKFNTRNLSNKKVLISKNVKYTKKGNINNDISNFNFCNNNITTYNSIKVGDSLIKDKNKLDNGNSGNQLEFKLSNNNIIKLKQPKAKNQKNNNVDTNNNVKNKQNYTKKMQSSLLKNDNSGENFSGILNYKNAHQIQLDEFINKNPINFNECQVLSNNKKVIRYKNNVLDFKFDKGNSYIMAINNLQECEDISLSAPKNIKNSNLNRINKLTTNFYKKNINNSNFADLLNN